MSRQILPLFILLAVALMSSPFARAESPSIDAAEEWKQAAVNREWAAVTQVDQAWEHSRQSEALRYSANADEIERRKMLGAAAGELAKAGDLELKGAGNYEMAVKNWHRVAAIWKRKGEPAKQDQAREQAEASTRAVIAACRRAAERYEVAAELYRQLDTTHTVKSAAMSEKAALCRERLAAR